MRYLNALALAAGLLAVPSLVLAQAGGAGRPAATAAGPQTPAPAQPPTSGVTVLHEAPDARETRNTLNEIFNDLPPSVREVLRIDPTLLNRADYISNYPVLAAFIEQHPEIAHNPAFFIGERQFDERNNTPSAQAFGAVNRAIENLTMLLVIGTITGGILFLARTIVEHRRWQRTMRTQTELQTKLIDRFSSSDDLLAYLQSPAGKGLTEAPAMPPAAPRPMSVPLSRIFWSLQSGIVAGALGAGFIVVSQETATSELADVLFGVGIIVFMIGIGFVVSAAVSYLLSQRLGLVRPLTAPFGGEAPES